jgi:hypothetical protein
VCAPPALDLAGGADTTQHDEKRRVDRSVQAIARTKVSGLAESISGLPAQRSFATFKSGHALAGFWRHRFQSGAIEGIHAVESPVVISNNSVELIAAARTGLE